MTSINELTAKLKAAAVKASGGDWIKESGDGWDAICSSDDRANGNFIIAHFVGPDAAANREFVQAANPANILALTEALEAAEKRIDELEQLLRASENNEMDARCHVAELEARTLTVKLPTSIEPHDFAPWTAKAFWTLHKSTVQSCLDSFKDACAAAGIKLQIEGE